MESIKRGARSYGGIDDPDEVCGNETVDLTKFPYAVIGRSSTNRTWLATADDGVVHATTLIGRDPVKTRELLVVRVVKIVRIPVNAEVVDVV